MRLLDIQGAFVISLQRRSDRLERFYAGLPTPWPLPRVETFHAVDGAVEPRPEWFVGPPGAWGCLRSHLGVYELALARGYRNIAVFEDDCLFAEDFAEDLASFLAEVPMDWDQIYLGGQHLLHPEPVDGRQVRRGKNVNRTHAYILGVSRVGKQLADCFMLPRPLKQQRCHIDYMFGTLHETGQLKSYCPVKWLCGQAAGQSDVNPVMKGKSECWWNR